MWIAHLHFPRLELGLVRELTLAEQVRHLEERALLGQLLDGVAAVAEDALVAIDEGDGAATARGVHEGGIIGHEAEVVVGDLDLPQVHRADGAFADRELVALAGAVVGDRKAVLGHARSSRLGDQAKIISLSLSLTSRASGLLLGQIGRGRPRDGTGLCPGAARAQPRPRRGAAGRRSRPRAPGAALGRAGRATTRRSMRARGRDSRISGKMAHRVRPGAPVSDRRCHSTSCRWRCSPSRTRARVTALTWHLAALTHPDPESTWGAVAINVAAARLLQGHRDFVPDVIEALRNNEAPALLLETVRRLPLLRRENIDAVAGSGLAGHRGDLCRTLGRAHRAAHRRRRSPGSRVSRRR